MKNKTVRMGVVAGFVASGFALAAVAGGGAALVNLLAGNQRFADGNMKHPHQTVAHRNEVAEGQHPDTIVLTCSDSRVAPEIVFDRGLGDLFVVRVAGNVVDAHALASMEYAVAHLHCRRLIVMGHEACGAVHAAVDAVEHPGHAESPHLAELISEIKPSVRKAMKQNPVDLLDASVRTNVLDTSDEILKRSAILRKAHKRGDLIVETAYYDLHSGLVSAP